MLWLATLTTILGLAFGGVQAGTQRESPTVYPVSILEPSRVAYPDTPHRAGFIVSVRTDYEAEKRGETFPDDFMILQVLSKYGRQVLAEKKFESSYGKFDLSLVDLTGDHEEEFLLVTGEGHGTNVRKETLRVFQRSGKDFRQMMSVTVSAYFGIDAWVYERTFTDINGDGITDLRLTLNYPSWEEIKEHPVDNPDLIPKISVQEWVFDPAKKKMVLFRSARRKE